MRHCWRTSEWVTAKPTRTFARAWAMMTTSISSLSSVSPLITYQDTHYRQAISADERLAVTLRYRPHKLLRQQLVARSFDMSKEIEHVQFVSTCRKDEKIVRPVAKNGNMSNGNIRHVASTCCWCGRGFKLRLETLQWAHTLTHTKDNVSKLESK